jgi:hypothetical protein
MPKPMIPKIEGVGEGYPILNLPNMRSRPTATTRHTLFSRRNPLRSRVVVRLESLGGVILSGAAFQAERRISLAAHPFLEGRSLTRLNCAGFRDDAKNRATKAASSSPAASTDQTPHP